MLNLLTCAIFAIGVGSCATTVDLPDAGDIFPTECQEDEPCWDCETMGNRICGPVAD